MSLQIACEIRNTGKPFSHNVVTGLVYDILSNQQVVRAYHCILIIYKLAS